MKKIWAVLVLVMGLVFYTSAFALTDSEHMELVAALDNNDAATFQRMIKSGSLDPKANTFGWSWMQVAANKGNLNIVKILVENGADVNYRHPVTKMTALALSAYQGDTKTVEYLISKGADPNIKMRGKVTVLRMVRDLGNTEMEKLLVSKGAVDDGCQGKCL